MTKNNKKGKGGPWFWKLARNVALTFALVVALAAFIKLCADVKQRGLFSVPEPRPAVTNRIVTASWFGDNTLTEPRFLSEMLPTFTNSASGGYEPYEVSPWAYPYDWYIAITDNGTLPAGSVWYENFLDVLRERTRTGGEFRNYKLGVELEDHGGFVDEDPPDVEWLIVDPLSSAVWDPAEKTLSGTGVAGTVVVTATDTNGVERSTGITMTPIPADHITKAFAGETNVTERYIWATNIFARLAAVSTNDEDMVTIYGCRTPQNWSSHSSGFTPWRYPRALGLWGTGGRMYTNEWYMQSQPFTKMYRLWCHVENQDFFWPELQTNLWCYSIGCHASTGGTMSWGNFDEKIATAVSEHYMITTHHTDWMWNRSQFKSPRFRYGHGDDEIVHCAYKGMKEIGQVPYKSGSLSDICLWYTSNSIPQQCWARFATGEVIDRLSKSGFSYTPGFTINSHQTVSPVCFNSNAGTAPWSTNAISPSAVVVEGAPSGWAGSWHPQPYTTDETNPYIFDVSEIPANVRNLEHMTHMQDSSDPYFLVAPNGRVVPCGQTTGASSGHNSGGGAQYNDHTLSQLDAMIRSHSSGTEGLSYWTFEDLWSGVGTNSVMTAQ